MLRALSFSTAILYLISSRNCIYLALILLRSCSILAVNTVMSPLVIRGSYGVSISSSQESSS